MSGVDFIFEGGQPTEIGTEVPRPQGVRRWSIRRTNRPQFSVEERFVDGNWAGLPGKHDHGSGGHTVSWW
jgi:hypothetical protein